MHGIEGMHGMCRFAVKTMPLALSPGVVSSCRSDEQRQAAVAAVRAKMPKQVKRKRRVITEDGMDAGMEEYIDFIYPDEGAPAPNLKLLEVRYPNDLLAVSVVTRVARMKQCSGDALSTS